MLDLKWPSTKLGTNIDTSFSQHCLNIVSISAPNVGEQRCHNIHTTLPEGCLKVSPQCWGAILPQHWHNIAWVLSQCWSPMLGSDIATIFTQHWYSIVTMLVNVGQHCDNIGILVEILYWYNIHTTMSGRPHNVAGMFTSIYKSTWPQCWGSTLRQCWHEYCHNVAAMVEC